MSYRYGTPAPAPRQPSLRTMMTGLLVAFVVVSLLVFLAGRVPFVPTPSPLDRSQTTYRNYVEADRARLGDYARTSDGRIQIPIDRAMDLITERGLPTRDNPSATP